MRISPPRYWTAAAGLGAVALLGWCYGAEGPAAWHSQTSLTVSLTVGLAAAVVITQSTTRGSRDELCQAGAAPSGSEEYCRAILMSVGDGIVATDGAGRVEIMNPVAEAMTGWLATEARGKPLEEIVHIVSLGTQRRLATMAQATPYGDGPGGATRRALLVARDGLKHAVALHSTSVRRDDGSLHGSVLILHDESTERSLENTLKANEQQYRTLVESAGEAIFVLKDGRVQFANSRTEQMIGHPVAVLKGRRFVHFIHPNDRASVAQCQLDGLQRGRSVAACSFRIVTGTGEERWVEMNIAPVEWESEPATLNLMTDITGRVRAEEERVALHSQLLQAHKMEAMGRLAAGVAHDFNNMLTAVLGYAGMALARVSPDSALYAELAEIEKAGRRSAGLARQLLVFARKQPATPSALSLNDAVASMLKMLARLIGENIHLEWKPGQQSSAVMMDPLQIDRLLANLAVNARDAISGVGTITVVTDLVQVGQEYCARHPGCVPGEYVTLAVSDDGCGMDEETLSHIFEPFFTTKEEGKGTGLGLATVYGIVQQNTGFVDVTSQPGRGTTFTVYFPHLRDCPAHGVAASAATRVPGGTETVLLVEDDPMVLQMGQMMLTGLGYAVLTAQTPAQALQLAAEHNGTIHLLITDVVMPEMNGGDLADKVVSLRPEMKRIYTSGYPADIIAPMGVLDGSEVFVAKPYSRQALADQVREALDRPSGPA